MNDSIPTGWTRDDIQSAIDIQMKILERLRGKQQRAQSEKKKAQYGIRIAAREVLLAKYCLWATRWDAGERPAPAIQHRGNTFAESDQFDADYEFARGE